MNRFGPERGIHSAIAPTRHRKRNKFRAPVFKVPMPVRKRKEAFPESPRFGRVEQGRPLGRLQKRQRESKLLPSRPKRRWMKKRMGQT